MSLRLSLAAGLVVALAVLSVLAVLRPAQVPSRAAQADAIAAELRCPDCQGLSVADSPSHAAAELRRQIEAMLAGGASADEVRAHFVRRYGDWILLAPPLPWASWLPFVILGAGALGLAWWLLGGRRRPTAVPVQRTDDPMRARVRDEVEALDA